MHFDGLIFDLDGTLWNCCQASTEAFNFTYEKFNLPRRVTTEFVASITGKPASECDEILLAEVPAHLRKEVSQHFDDSEVAFIQKHAKTSLYDGVEAGLRRLQETYKLFLVSNCGVRYLEVFQRHTNVGSLFTDTECFGRLRKLKHDNIADIVKRQSLKSPCYIGDTASDEDAANRAGVPFFYVSYGFGKPVGTPPAFASFAELTDYFHKLALLKTGS
jgi:phosphoglycolate phosphatase